MAMKSLHVPPNAPPSQKKPHHLGHRKRLREKFDQYGGESLHDYELLELLLFQVLPRFDVKPLSKTLIQEFEGLLGVFSASPHRLGQLPGVGPAVIHCLKLIHALMIKMHQLELRDKIVLQSWQQVLDYCRISMEYSDKEKLRLFFLNQRNQLIRDEVQQVGTVNHTPFYPREIMKRALELGATALILAHNHPSGDPTPSSADIDLTLKLQKIGEELGVRLHDHVIVGKNRIASFKAMGIL